MPSIQRVLIAVSLLSLTLTLVMQSRAFTAPPRDAAAQTPADTVRQRIAALIARLGSEGFPEREAATVELEKIGAPALPQLQEALKSDDPEVKIRAQSLIYAIDPQSRPRESINLESVNGEEGAVILSGYYKQVLIRDMNGRGKVESAEIDAEEIWIGALNGEALLVLKGKVKKLRIGDVNGESQLDLRALRAEQIEVGDINGSPKLWLRTSGPLQFAGQIGGGPVISVQAQGNVTLTNGIGGGAQLTVSESQNFHVMGSVGTGATIDASYRGEAVCPGPSDRIKLIKLPPAP